MVSNDLSLDQRRAILAPAALPPARVEYVVRMDLEGETGELALLYVPDRFTIGLEALSDYIAVVDGLNLPTELKAVTILEDLVNELVCRWIRVSLNLDGKTVILEDRQPGWSNADLLARLP
jgi:hypothetical protein